MIDNMQEIKKTLQIAELVEPDGLKHSLALFVQQVEKRCGLLADQVDAARVVDVVDVVPADALGSVFFLQTHNANTRAQCQWHIQQNFTSKL